MFTQQLAGRPPLDSLRTPRSIEELLYMGPPAG